VTALCQEPQDQSSSDPNSPKFACPFYRLDPIAHGDCLRFTLHRVQDVMQHLRRKHKTELPPTIDLSASAKERRQLSAERRWLRIWSELFPGRDAPPSVRLGSHVEEAAALVDYYWKRYSDHVLRGAMQMSGGASAALESCQEGPMGSLYDVVLGMVQTVKSRGVSTGPEDATSPCRWVCPEYAGGLPPDSPHGGLHLDSTNEWLNLNGTGDGLAGGVRREAHSSVHGPMWLFQFDSEAPQHSGIHVDDAFSLGAGLDQEIAAGDLPLTGWAMNT
jgi:hypothetical protein